MNGFKTIFVVMFIFIISILLFKVVLYSKAYSTTDSKSSYNEVITVTGKDIIANINGTNGSTSTTNTCIVFTDKGAYLVEPLIGEVSMYGQLQIGQTYKIWTVPSFDFNYVASIIKIEKK